MKRLTAILLLCASLTGAAFAQGAVMPRVYTPSVLYQPIATPTPVPAPTPTPQAGGAVWLYDIAMPFNVLGGVEPIGVQDSTGAWFVSVFRLDSGSLNGTWIVTWREGETTARPIGQVGSAPAAIAPADTSLTNSRGSIAVSFDRKQLYSIAWQDKEGGSRRPKLRLHIIQNYVP